MTTTAEQGTIDPAPACASVALDIGAGSGALVLYPSERFRGREIEISRVDRQGCSGHGRRVHTGVHERTTEVRSRLTAIFGSLPAGDYVVWEDAATERAVVTVLDGAISEVELK